MFNAPLVTYQTCEGTGTVTFGLTPVEVTTPTASDIESWLVYDVLEGSANGGLYLD